VWDSDVIGLTLAKAQLNKNSTELIYQSSLTPATSYLSAKQL